MKLIIELSCVIITSMKFEALKPKIIPEETESSSETGNQEKVTLIKELEEQIKAVETAKERLKDALTEAEKSGDWTSVNEAEFLLQSALSLAKTTQRKLEGKETELTITTDYTYKNETGKEITETIELDFEQEISSLIEFYKKHKIEVPVDFEEQMQDIWQRNSEDLREAIEKYGFDETLFIPGGLSVPDVHTKMSAGYNETYQGSNFRSSGSFEGVKEKTIEPRIILVHKNRAKNLADRSELKETLGKTAESFIKSEETMSLTDYLIYQKKYFEETGKHLDSDTWTWLPGSRVGARVVCARWSPVVGQLIVSAYALGSSSPFIGCRPSRCFL